MNRIPATVDIFPESDFPKASPFDPQQPLGKFVYATNRNQASLIFPIETAGMSFLKALAERMPPGYCDLYHLRVWGLWLPLGENQCREIRLLAASGETKSPQFTSLMDTQVGGIGGSNLGQPFVPEQETARQEARKRCLESGHTVCWVEVQGVTAWH